MSLILDGSNSVTFPDGTVQTTTAKTGMVNRIINGGMSIWQRGTSITGSVASSSASYWADRWCFYRGANASAITLSQQTSGGATNFQYYARIQRTASNTSIDSLSLNQSAEIFNSFDLAGNSVTLSFWARAGANYSATSNKLGYVVTTGTGTVDNNSLWNSWTGATNILSSDVILTTSWQRFSVTANVGSTVTQISAGFQINLTGTAGAADYVDITGVQLEKGSTATSFDYRPYGTELALCQRYFQTVSDRSNTKGSYYSITAGRLSGNLAPPMRSAPTTTLAGTSYEYVGIGSVTGTNGAVSSTTTGYYFDATSLSGGVYSAQLMYLGQISLSAEL